MIFVSYFLKVYVSSVNQSMIYQGILNQARSQPENLREGLEQNLEGQIFLLFNFNRNEE